ncbi:MAG: glutamine--fructose-6-phosphate transaminase (isomerizing), partial [Patescibacteria group bacterium]
MCGIYGYVIKYPAQDTAVPAADELVEGLRRVAYRGYDSAGIVVPHNGQLVVIKRAGKLENLIAALDGHPYGEAMSGIGHTRWATHGKPTDANSHPHTSCRQHVAVVHNGIISNHNALRTMLEGRQHVFRSETDTETLAHLIGEYLNGDPVEAVRTALSEVEGTYAMAVIFRDYPGTIVFAKNGKCPLLLGIGDDAFFVASDAASFRRHTDQYIPIEDGQIGFISPDSYQITDMNKVPVSAKVETIEWQLSQIEKGGELHFMLAEIKGQPQSLADAIAGRLLEDDSVKFGGLEDQRLLLQTATEIVLTAAGTSFNAALYGEILLEEIAGITTRCKNASELATREHLCFAPGTIAWAISQSGETADLLHALGTLRRLEVPTFGLVNVVGSTIARETLAGTYLHVGPEIGVASTKAYTGQGILFNLLALYLRQLRQRPREPWMDRYVQQLRQIPDLVGRIIAEQSDRIRQLAEKYAGCSSIYFLGKGVNLPTALEGALKLKEVSYIHAEGYPAGELKHGPLALLTDDFPSLFIVPRQDHWYDKV